MKAVKVSRVLKKSNRKMVAEWGECSNGSTNSGPPLNTVDIIRKLKHTASNKYSNDNIISNNQSTNSNASVSSNICHSVKVPTNLLTWENHSSCLVSGIKECASLPSYYDVVLVCNKKSIVAHRAVLSSASGYFKELLVGFQEDVITICIEGFKWSIVKKLVEYMYSGQTYFNLYEFSDLISGGEFLKLQGIENFKKNWLSFYEEKLDITDHDSNAAKPRVDMKRKACEIEDFQNKRSKGDSEYVQIISTPKGAAIKLTGPTFGSNTSMHHKIVSSNKYGVKDLSCKKSTGEKRKTVTGLGDSHQANYQNNCEEINLPKISVEPPQNRTDMVKKVDIIPIMKNGQRSVPINYSNGNSLQFSDLLSASASLASNTQHSIENREENTPSHVKPKVSILPINKKTTSSSNFNSDYKFATILASLSAAREQDMNDVTSKAPMEIYPVMNLESAQLKKTIKGYEDQGDSCDFRYENSGSRTDNVGSRVDNIGSRVDNVGSRVDNVGSRVDNIGSRVDNVSSRVDNVCSRVDNIGSYPDNNVSHSEYNGSRSEYNGSCSEYNGSHSVYNGSHSVYNGSRPDNIGSRPDNIGSRPDNIGSRPDNIGSRPDNIGSRPDNIGSRPDNIGSRPDNMSSFSDSNGSHTNDIGSLTNDIGSRADISGSRADISGSQSDTSFSQADMSSSRADGIGSQTDSNGGQYKFRTQEEIEAALDVYHRKLAFHEPRPCPSCNRMYRDAATLRTHITIMHSKSSEPFICSCGQLFNTKFDMYHHKKNGHCVNNK